MGISSLASKYGFQDFPHFSSGRSGSKINKIVIHHMATTNYDTVPGVWKTRQASAHYGIGAKGEIRAYVDESNTAWHAGNWDVNISSIGIEHVNTTGDPTWLVAQATIDASARLCADIAKRYGLGNLVVGKNLFSHSDFSATACCGPYLKPRLQEIANKANAINYGTSTPPPAPTGGLYRVRKNWADAASQKGAFKDLTNAKKIADTNAGYSVFDDKGNKVYPNAAAVPVVKTLTVQINGLNIRNKPSLSGAIVGSYNKGASWTLPKDEKLVIADGWVWARAPKGYCAVGKNTGKSESDDYIFIN